jgi:hypothetical protein
VGAGTGTLAGAGVGTGVGVGTGIGVGVGTGTDILGSSLTTSGSGFFSSASGEILNSAASSSRFLMADGSSTAAPLGTASFGHVGCAATASGLPSIGIMP